MGTRGKTKKGKTQRKMDKVRRRMNNHGLTKEDTRDRDMWRKFWV
jgi:cysteinyl-tRNA synthetase